jgi:hypothetical protein
MALQALQPTVVQATKAIKQLGEAMAAANRQS